MEGELWAVVYRLVRRLGKRPVGCTYSDWVIVAIYLWSVLHDRPLHWVWDSNDRPSELEGVAWPSYKTVRTRLQRASAQALCREVDAALRERFPASWCYWMDGRPLTVSWNSRDPDAKVGRGVRGLAKGYKLHVICDARRMIVAWRVMPMNVSEVTMAKVMLRYRPGSGYLVGDTLFDSNPLYERSAKAGYILLTGQKSGEGLGHRRHSRHRLASLALAQRPFGQELLKWRDEVERMFGLMGNCGEGLGPLPNWVRRSRRVRRWVGAKIIFYHARLVLKNKGLVA
jgi:hypothetical protein